MAERKSIIWGEIANRQFKKALIYCRKNNNIAFSERLVAEVKHTFELILENNYIGKQIPKTNFRSVLVYSFLIIYEVTDQNIAVILFWNTRRNTKVLKILLSELT
jgi:plasmid stabilization system protein ParE